MYPLHPQLNLRVRRLLSLSGHGSCIVDEVACSANECALRRCHAVFKQRLEVQFVSVSLGVGGLLSLLQVPLESAFPLREDQVQESKACPELDHGTYDLDVKLLKALQALRPACDEDYEHRSDEGT